MAVRVGVGLFTGQIPEGSARTFVREYRETLDLVRLAETRPLSATKRWRVVEIIQKAK